MGQLSAGIAHELNNPLGIITLYSSILKNDMDERTAMYNDIKMIEEQAERCKNIVGGLLNFARKNQVRLSPTDLYEFIDNSIKSVVIPENIQVSVVNEMNDNTVSIDKDQMMQVLTNIEKNAVEAMPDGGKLKSTSKIQKTIPLLSISAIRVSVLKKTIWTKYSPLFSLQKKLEKEQV